MNRRISNHINTVALVLIVLALISAAMIFSKDNDEYKVFIVAVKTDLRQVIIETDRIGITTYATLGISNRCSWLFNNVKSSAHLKIKNKKKGEVLLISPEGEKCLCYVVDTI